MTVKDQFNMNVDEQYIPMAEVVRKKIEGEWLFFENKDGQPLHEMESVAMYMQAFINSVRNTGIPSVPEMKVWEGALDADELSWCLYLVSGKPFSFWKKAITGLFEEKKIKRYGSI